MSSCVIKTNELKSVMPFLLFALAEGSNISNDKSDTYHCNHPVSVPLTLKYQKVIMVTSGLMSLQVAF